MARLAHGPPRHRGPDRGPGPRSRTGQEREPPTAAGGMPDAEGQRMRTAIAALVAILAACSTEPAEPAAPDAADSPDSPDAAVACYFPSGRPCPVGEVCLNTAGEECNYVACA